MIHVDKAPEPADFDSKVRQPGKKWLADNPDAKGSEAKNYWSKCKGDMLTAYGRTCAYTCRRMWARELSIDHFEPKSQNKGKIYEWDNYRLSAQSINQIKLDEPSANLVDPFEIPDDAFELNLASGKIAPNGDVLHGAEYAKAEHTIKRLRLNDEGLLEFRSQLIASRNIDLIRWASPFVAREIERQRYTFDSNPISLDDLRKNGES